MIKINSRVKNERNLSPPFWSTILIMRRICSFKIKVLSFNSAILSFCSIIPIKTSSLLIIITFTPNFTMDQCAFRYLHRLFSELSYVNCKPLFLRILLRIYICNLIFFWWIIPNDPLDFDLNILLIITSHNSKAKEEYISQWFECNCIPRC